jgi:hypothetical protein
MCFAPHHEHTGGMEIKLHTFLALALIGSVWPSSHWGKEPPCTRWLDLPAILDIVMTEIPVHLLGVKLWLSSPYHASLLSYMV